MAGLFKSHTKEDENTIIKNELLEDISEGLVVLDELGNVIYANHLASSIMDAGLFGPIDIVNKNIKEITYREKTYLTSYRPISEELGIKGTIAILNDVIGESEARETIRELKAKLQRSDNFKKIFLANMSHEIRTPIHAIIGFSELIGKNDVPEEVKKQVGMIKDSSYSLLAIINDILDLSKIESEKMELVNSNYYISYIIRDIEATYSLLALRKGIEFNIHLDENIPSYIYGDKIRLRSALLNILNNAIKFTKEGSIDFYINVVKKHNDEAILEFIVEDTGVGIKEENLQLIFESFSKFEINNDYAVEGRGVGLALANGYIKLMNGTLKVESTYGKGSKFTITVKQKIVNDAPLDMNIVNARKEKNRQEKFMARDCSVLVVDDNPVNLLVADGLMKSYGLTADKESGGAAAIKRCETKDYDIIFMDQMMPEVDGIMAMKEIRKLNDHYKNDCAMIVLTADAMAGVRDRLLLEGFDEYLSKPLEIHRLEAILKRFVKEDKLIYESDSDEDADDTIEWTDDEIHKFARKIISSLEEYDFERIYDLLDEMGANKLGDKTNSIYEKLEFAMTEMDLDALRSTLGELA